MKIIIELHEINEVSVSAHFSNVACAKWGSRYFFIFVFASFCFGYFIFHKVYVFIKVFPRKGELIHRKHLLKMSLMENFIFSVVV